VVDKAVLASKIAAVRDATARIRSVLPPSADAFRADRTAREVVVFNLLARIMREELWIDRIDECPADHCDV